MYLRVQKAADREKYTAYMNQLLTAWLTIEVVKTADQMPLWPGDMEGEMVVKTDDQLSVRPHSMADERVDKTDDQLSVWPLTMSDERVAKTADQLPVWPHTMYGRLEGCQYKWSAVCVTPY